MKKEEILQNIKSCFEQKQSKSKNSMGVSVSYYNPYYLTGRCFKEEELLKFSEKELNNLIKLADFASEAFSCQGMYTSDRCIHCGKQRYEH